MKKLFLPILLGLGILSSTNTQCHAGWATGAVVSTVALFGAYVLDGITMGVNAVGDGLAGNQNANLRGIEGIGIIKLGLLASIIFCIYKSANSNNKPTNDNSNND